ncbi:MAG: hypothetical protein L6R00_14080 [Phycisphaerae bacterium]|nr:hypothetical protein [Phycisphaerae bacterium]
MNASPDMPPPARRRRTLRAWRVLVSLAGLLSRGRSRGRPPPAEVRRIDHAGHTRRVRPRFDERLRDLFRPTWLRLSRRDDV